MMTEIMNKLEIGLIVLGTVILVVMNVFTFDPTTLTVLRVLLAICWITYMILSIVTYKIEKAQKN